MDYVTIELTGEKKLKDKNAYMSWDQNSSTVDGPIGGGLYIDFLLMIKMKL